VEKMSEVMPVCKMCQQRQPESHSVFECMDKFRTALERLVKFGEGHMTKHHKDQTAFFLSAELTAARTVLSIEIIPSRKKPFDPETIPSDLEEQA